MSLLNDLFSAFSFISFILVSIPFAWHLEAWNTGTCIYMAWVSLGSLILFINSVVWDGNVVNRAPVYCDITTKIIVGLPVALPAASLCINRRLYYIMRVSSATRTTSEKRRNILVDCLIGIGIPIVVMILHVVVQGHRFDIFENIGCWPVTYNTHLSYVFVLGPPLAISLAAVVYCVITMKIIWANYKNFKRLLSSNGTNRNTANRYLRLLGLASLETIIAFPLHLYALINATKAGVEPWISWEETHYNFGLVMQFPAKLTSGPELTRWMMVVAGFIFFAFFGFADEAIKNYRSVYNIVGRQFNWSLFSIPGSYNRSGGSGVSNDRGMPNFGRAQQQRSGTTLGSVSEHDNPNNGDKEGKKQNKKKGKGLFRGNGTESWMESFSVFADRVKLVVLQSSGTISFNGQGSTIGDPNPEAQPSTSAMPNNGLQLCVTKEMIQRTDTDSASIITSLTAVGALVSKDVEDNEKMMQGKNSFEFVGKKENTKEEQDITADVFVPEISTFPPLPPVPPKDWSSSIVSPPESQPSRKTNQVIVPSSIDVRTPPRQMIPDSVSPPPYSSFLDLSISPTRDAWSADNRV